MKAVQEQLLIDKEQLFILKEHNIPRFLTPHHYHRELEIKLMIRGSGKSFIGDNIYEYKAGDLVLIGPNIPHHWVSDDHYEQNGTPAQCIFLQFQEDFLGEGFYSKTEAYQISQLMQKSRHGIQFFGEGRARAESLLLKLQAQSGFQKMICFLELLNELAQCWEIKFLGRANYSTFSVEEEKARIDTVYDYIISEFKNEISLSRASEISNLSKAAFCQFFKKRTAKTFSDFVNEVRLNFACRLLLEDRLNILEICYESGFKNLSYFNRKFRDVYKMSPKEFKSRRNF
ncbi:MAG TPA: AraC family transcriptional regulator [Cytophagaceae bacterium]|jgi:AraC-like DNA-binding protein